MRGALTMAGSQQGSNGPHKHKDPTLWFLCKAHYKGNSSNDGLQDPHVPLPNTKHYMLYTIYSNLSTMHYILCTPYCTLYIIYYTLYTTSPYMNFYMPFRWSFGPRAGLLELGLSRSLLPLRLQHQALGMLGPRYLGALRPVGSRATMSL